MIRKICNFKNNYHAMIENIKAQEDAISLMKNKIEEQENEIQSLIQKNIEIENNYKQCVAQIPNIENGFLKLYKIMQHKFCENKMQTNLVLYNNSFILNKSKYDEKFEPLVSIIIPVYNGAKYMKKAIDSALAQTYKNIEIIVVNDRSTDDGETDKIAKSYGEKIRYIYKENGGVSSALNVGIKNMKGDYFTWLSHDDVFNCNHIETHIEYFRHFNDNETITYSCFNFIDSNGRIKDEESIDALIHMSDYKLSQNTHYACILRGEVNGGNVFIPRKAFDECGLFQEGNRITQEKEMWSRLLKKYRFVNIPIVTYSIRCHDEQVSNTSNNVAEETRKKIIEIIKGITEEEMIAESGSVSMFYLELYNHYKDNNIIDTANEIYRMYEESI